MDKKSICKLLDEKLAPFKAALEKIDSIESNVSFVSAKYDNLLKDLESLKSSRENTKSPNMKDDIQELTNRVNNSINQIEQLKQDLDDHEQYIRRECLEIRGIPLGLNEDTNEIVRKVGHLVDIDISERDISVSHRLPHKNKPTPQSDNKDPSIIVRFVRRDLRDEFYKARSKLKEKTTRDLGIERLSPQKLFITESLTKRNKNLLNKCLQKKKELQYKFLWTKYGKILLRKHEKSHVVAICTENDLDKLT